VLFQSVTPTTPPRRRPPQERPWGPFPSLLPTLRNLWFRLDAFSHSLGSRRVCTFSTFGGLSLDFIPVIPRFVAFLLFSFIRFFIWFRRFLHTLLESKYLNAISGHNRGQDSSGPGKENLLHRNVQSNQPRVHRLVTEIGRLNGTRSEQFRGSTIYSLR